MESPRQFQAFLRRWGYVFSVGLIGLLAPQPLANSQPVEDARWQAFYQTFQAQEYVEASGALAKWVDEQEKVGIRSPQAHYNLALTHWALKQPGPSVFHLLKSLTLRFSPFRIWQDLQAVGSAQKTLGLNEPLSQHPLFFLYFLINANSIILLFTLGAWLTGLAFFLIWWKKEQPSVWPRTFLVTAVICVCVGLVGYLNSYYFLSIGVLHAKEKGVSLYKHPKESTESRIVNLPSGTIVRVSEKGNSFTKISHPFEGWILSDKLLALEKPRFSPPSLL